MDGQQMLPVLETDLEQVAEAYALLDPLTKEELRQFACYSRLEEAIASLGQPARGKRPRRERPMPKLREPEGGEPEGDAPFSLVGAPKKPRNPQRRATAAEPLA
jgi:hypothetical protein